jgi:hypothetical protein
MFRKFKYFISNRFFPKEITINPEKKIVLLFAQYSSWGACSNFNEMFNSNNEYQSWEVLGEPFNKHDYSFGQQMNKRKLFVDNKHSMMKLSSNQKTRVIIFDFNGIPVFEKFLKITKTKYSDYNISVFWTGTPYVKNYLWCNNWSEKNQIRAFAMCDLLRFSKKSLPLMQPYNLAYYSKLASEVDNEKGFRNKKEIILCHSPGHKGSSNEKGSMLIHNVISKLNSINYRQIGDGKKFLSHEACLIEKEKCDIFIDKIGTKCAGGIGKSGIESIMLGKPTICSMHKSILKYPYQNLPVIDIETSDQLNDFLIDVVRTPEILKEIREKTLRERMAFSYEKTIGYLNGFIKD